MPRADLVLLAALAVPLAVGCDKPPPSGAGASSSSSAAPASSASAAAVVAPPTAPQPAPQAPDNLDVAALQKTLKCAGDAKSGPCRVLAQLATCKEWSAVVPSGDGRWLGRGYVVEGAKTTEQVTMVRSKRVPSAEVAPGQLPVKIAITELAKEEGAAFDQAERAIRSYERSDVPPRSNPTLEYIKKRAEWPDNPASRTAGGQVLINVSGGAYACQGAKQQLVLVERRGARAASGDGLYAELWPTSW